LKASREHLRVGAQIQCVSWRTVSTHSCGDPPAGSGRPVGKSRLRTPVTDADAQFWGRCAAPVAERWRPPRPGRLRQLAFAERSRGWGGPLHARKRLGWTPDRCGQRTYTPYSCPSKPPKPVVPCVIRHSFRSAEMLHRCRSNACLLAILASDDVRDRMTQYAGGVRPSPCRGAEAYSDEPAQRRGTPASWAWSNPPTLLMPPLSSICHGSPFLPGRRKCLLAQGSVRGG
jgi:hypothetical protein